MPNPEPLEPSMVVKKPPRATLLPSGLSAIERTALSIPVGAKAVGVPPLAVTAAARVRVAPPTDVNCPPKNTVLAVAWIAFTVLLTFGFQEVRAPVVVSIAARWFRAVPFTVVKAPPRYRVFPSGEAASATTWPLMLGAKEFSAPVVRL